MSTAALLSTLTMARLPMTIFSAVTHATATLLCLQVIKSVTSAGNVGGTTVLAAFAVTLLCQMTAHFSGEYCDWPSDRVQLSMRLASITNNGMSPSSATSIDRRNLTGGSGELKWHGGRATGLVLSAVCFMLALGITLAVFPAHAIIIAVPMAILALQYSAPPFSFNHRGRGEAVAALVMNIILPIWAFSAMLPSSLPMTLDLYRLVVTYPPMLMLMVPAACVKFALFLILNLADRRADFIGKKYTLPVMLDAAGTWHLMCLSMLSALASAVGIAVVPALAKRSLTPTDVQNLLALALMLRFSLPRSMAIYRYMSALIATTEWYATPQIPGTVVRCALELAPQPVIAMLVATVIPLLMPNLFPAICSLTPSANALHIDWQLLLSSDLYLRSVMLIPFLLSLRRPRAPFPPLRPPSSSAATAERSVTVAILGAGVAGLATASLLVQQLQQHLSQGTRVRIVLLEKRRPDQVDNGADLGLWPSSIDTISRIAGPRAEQEQFWFRHTYPIHNVYMDKIPPSGKPQSLRRVDMLNVVRQGLSLERNDKDALACFRLVARRPLMQLLESALQYHANTDAVSVQTVYDAKVTDVCESPHKVSVTYTSLATARNETIDADIVIGADGIASLARGVVRTQVALSDLNQQAQNDQVRYSGEVCYRGVVDFSAARRSADLQALYDVFVQSDRERPNSMPLWYGTTAAGDQYRAAWGFINSAKTTGYWWVKEPRPAADGVEENDPRALKQSALDQCRWAHPLRQCLQLTEPQDFYIQPVIDRQSDPFWCSSRIVLVGDAAHPVTPNNAQGANMAIEDADVLSLALARRLASAGASSSTPDPFAHVDAFIAYVQLRQRHAFRVAADSYAQAKLSQWRHPVLVWVRETLLRRIPARAFERKLAAGNVWTWHAAVEQQYNLHRN
ncbi:hypothetical protein RI367_005407 [Sorochytrium milnesiophthora]